MTINRNSIKRLLLAPLVYCAAILLLFEEWLWDECSRLTARFPGLWPVRKIEEALARLPPSLALCVFVTPAILLFPVKVLALFAIGRGYVIFGVTVILAAKLLGTALVVRIYTVTKPALLSMPWFERWHGRFIRLKDRMIQLLKSTAAWRSLRAQMAAFTVKRRAFSVGLRKRYFTGRLGRFCRKLFARMRARNQR